jgi:hypothetical protein
VRCMAPLVQVPPRGLWGRSGATTHADAEDWLGGRLDPAPSPEDMVWRYLTAFGPATSGDVQTWTRLTGLKQVVEGMRARLRTFTDERGRELFDVPDAPLPDPETPAPPRFLPQYDNVTLSHADRTRVVSEDDRRRFPYAGSALLVDGFGAAAWRHTAGTLTVTPLRPLSDQEQADVTAEGTRLLSLLAPGTRPTVTFDPPVPPA